MTKKISEYNNRCTVNDFICACSFIFFIFFVKNHLLVISDVIICTWIHNTCICKYFEFVSVYIQRICECTYSENL